MLKALVPEATVYFQPPANVTMKYPAIVYQRDYAVTKFADNSPYRHTKRYQLTIMDTNPDSGIYDKIAGLPMCIFNRHFTADNLNHDVFSLFY